jgi:hypothetical protein
MDPAAGLLMHQTAVSTSLLLSTSTRIHGFVEASYPLRQNDVFLVAGGAISSGRGNSRRSLTKRQRLSTGCGVYGAVTLCA